MFAFLKTLRKSRPYLFFGMVLLCGFFLFPSATFAATGDTSNEMIKRLLDLIIQIEKVMYALLVPAIGLIGKLLSNEWVTGAGSTIEDTIQLLWVFIRNMVNIVFVVILLVVALMHVMNPSGDQGNYAIKAILPRLVIAIVAVNFSLFACRVVLDFSNTLTTAVFSIPNTVTKVDTFKDGGMFFTWTGSNKNDKECLRKHYYLNLDQPLTQIGKKDTTTSTKPTGGTGGTTPTTGGTTTTPASTSTSTPSKTDWSPFKTSILVPLKECKGSGDKPPELKHLKGFSGGQTVYYCAGDTYAALQTKKNELNTQCITSLQSLVFDKRNAMYAFAFGLLHIPAYEKVLETDFTLDKFFVSTAVAMIFLAMISLVVFAMATAFLIRSVVLWGLMALSPLWVLDIVFSGGGPDALKTISEKASFKAFLGTAMMPVYVGAVLSASFVMLLAVKASYAAAGAAANQIGLGNVTLHFGDNPIFSGVSNIQDMLFSLMVIAALWVAVFAALKANDATGFISKSLSSFENIGNSVGEFAAGLPMRAPIIPTPFGMKASPKQIENAITQTTRGISNKWDDAESLMGGAKDKFGIVNAGTKQDSEKLDAKANVNVTDINTFVGTHATKYGMTNKFTNETIANALQKLPTDLSQKDAVKEYVKVVNAGSSGMTRDIMLNALTAVGATEAVKAVQDAYNADGTRNTAGATASSPTHPTLEQTMGSSTQDGKTVWTNRDTALHATALADDQMKTVRPRLTKMLEYGLRPGLVGGQLVKAVFKPGTSEVFPVGELIQKLGVMKTEMLAGKHFTKEDLAAIAKEGNINTADLMKRAQAAQLLPEEPAAQ